MSIRLQQLLLLLGIALLPVLISGWQSLRQIDAMAAAIAASTRQSELERERHYMREKVADIGTSLQNKLDPADIKSVRCEVPHLVKISLVNDKPSTPSQAQFSMPFAVGCILAFGKLGPDQITPETLEDKALKMAMAKVEMVEADDLNGPDFQPQFPECARVTIAMASGDAFTDFLGAATGMPSNPISDEALSGKFRTCASFAPGRTRSRAPSTATAARSSIHPPPHAPPSIDPALHLCSSLSMQLSIDTA